MLDIWGLVRFSLCVPSTLQVCRQADRQVKLTDVETLQQWSDECGIYDCIGFLEQLYVLKWRNRQQTLHYVGQTPL